MEQNRTYIIILIVTLVSAGIIAAGVYLLNPAGDGEEIASGAGDFDPYRFIREPADGESDEPGTLPADGVTAGPENISDIENQSTDSNIDLTDAESPLIFVQPQVYGTIGEPAAVQDSDSEPTTQPTASNGTTQTPPTISDEQASASGGVTGPTTVDTESAGVSVAAQSERSKSPGDLSSSAAEHPSAGTSDAGEIVQVREYWIQVFSSTSRDSVESLRDELVVHGLRARISTVENEDQLFFRLRFGPFPVKEEADKFLSYVQAVPRYESSYISLEYSRR